MIAVLCKSACLASEIQSAAGAEQTVSYAMDASGSNAEGYAPWLEDCLKGNAVSAVFYEPSFFVDPARFRELSRRDELSKVWKGILAAEAAGLAIKLNVVLVRGINDESDAVELARLTLDKPWQVRFIELMPLGGMSVFQKSKVVREAELRARLETDLGPLTSVGAGVLDGEARIFRAAQAPGTIGFISSVSRSFCCACRRARLTADGHLRLCLLHEAEVDLLTALRSGATDVAIERLIQQGLHRKPLHHALAQDNAPADRLMSQIGG